MAPTPPTVVSLKQSFLTAQTRLLSQPLTPTRAWHSNNNNNDPSSEDSALPEKAVDDALFKLNHRLQQHSRRVYAPQATRHVAEQIDQLYWNAAEAATQRDRDSDEEGESVEGLNLGADLTDPAVLTTLPSEWDTNSSDASPPSAQRYAALAADLHALAERKQHAAARVARLRKMQALLQPFHGPPPPHSPPNPSSGSGGHDGEEEGGSLDSVQENLVTRNGEVEAELHRMRMLLARVGGRVGQLRETGGRAGSEGGESSAGSLFSERGGGGEDGEAGMEMDERRKVGLLLERF